MTVNQKRCMLTHGHTSISLQRQCQLIGLSRSTAYYKAHRNPVTSVYNRHLIQIMDELYTAHPHLGREGMTRALRRKGYPVNSKRVRRLMKEMGLESVYPKPGKKLSLGNKKHKKYPYLLRDISINKPDHVWCADITYIRLSHGHVYLVAIMDWYSRYVVHWELSNSLEDTFCVTALRTALQKGRKPEIFNTDQGSQFTGNSFTDVLHEHKIRISMDGRGRALDNVMVERLWRTLKYEDIYLREYSDPLELRKGISAYMKYYNTERPHSSLKSHTPEEVYKVFLCVN